MTTDAIVILRTDLSVPRQCRDKAIGRVFAHQACASQRVTPAASPPLLRCYVNSGGAAGRQRGGEGGGGGIQMLHALAITSLTTRLPRDGTVFPKELLTADGQARDGKMKNWGRGGGGVKVMHQSCTVSIRIWSVGRSVAIVQYTNPAQTLRENSPPATPPTHTRLSLQTDRQLTAA